MPNLFHGRVVDYIVDGISAVGTHHVFGVDGANIEDLFDAAHFSSDLTVVLAKHEFSAAAMADAYSRSSSRLGVVAATSGGGCLNLVPGLGESLASRIPVLALIGQAPTALDGHGSFQDTSGCNGAMNAETLFGAVSVYCRRVTVAAEIREALPEAVRAARTGGPAVLLLPKDIQQSELTWGMPVIERPQSDGHGHLDRLAPLISELANARGPVTVIAGEQVARDDARAELEDLRIALRATLACVPDAKDVATVPMNGVAGSLGVTGIMGHPATVESIRESALCLLVGTRLSMTARGGLEDALDGVRVLSVGSAEPYVPCTHVEATDLRTTLGFLARAVASSVPPEHPVRRGRSELSPPVSRGPGVRYRDAMRALDESLPAGVDIVVDAGNTGAAALHYLPHRRDGRFLVALGMGGMGYSFGAGIGVACARGRRTVVIAGDGAFFMHGLELHTAVEHRLPVTFVVLNNNAHAMCVTREQLFYGDRYSYNRFHPSWIAAGLSAMFPGLFAVEVSDGEHLRPALATALRRPGPSVLSVACSADEIPPFAPFLAALESQSPVQSGQRTKEDHVHVRVSA